MVYSHPHVDGLRTILTLTGALVVLSEGIIGSFLALVLSCVVYK